jgi:aryl-alcohol dehydrogenase-like predicted oxidoreductase
VEYRQFAQTPVNISRIAFGCSPASGYDYGQVDEFEWRLAVQAALENGVNFFDVADVYGFGRAETLLSEALGGRRHEVVVATKCGLAWDQYGKVRRDLSRQNVLRSVEGSLRRLRLDVIPLYQIHWPDQSTPLEETFEALAQCQRQGKIRYIGVSNFSRDLLEEAQTICAFQSEQVAFNLLSREPEREVFPWCKSVGVSILAHSGLARGFLAGRYVPGQINGFSDTRKNSPYFSEDGRAEKQHLLDAIRRISTEENRPFSSVAIRWILDSAYVSTVLIGIKSRAQLMQNLQAIGWHLGASKWRLLEELASRCPAGLAGVPAHKQ